MKKTSILFLFLLFLTTCSSSQKTLFKSIESFNDKSLKKILQNDKSLITTKNAEGETPLVLSAKIGNLNAINILMQAGSNVNSPSKNGENPLTIAVSKGYYNIVKALITQYHADIHYVNSLGISPAKIAYDNNKNEILNFLLTNGASKIEMFEISAPKILENNSSRFSENEKTALNFIQNNSWDELEDFLNSHKLNLKTADEKGNSIVHYLAKVDHNDLLEILLKNTAETSLMPNNDGVTPLMNALMFGFLDNAKSLLPFSKTKDTDKTHNSIWYYALKSDNEDVLNWLAETTPSTVNIKNVLWITPLHIAVENKNFKAVEILLKAGANPNARDRENGETPLFYAFKTKNKDMLELLLSSQADPNVPNNHQQTVLKLAAQSGQQDLIDLFNNYIKEPIDANSYPAEENNNSSDENTADKINNTNANDDNSDNSSSTSENNTSVSNNSQDNTDETINTNDNNTENQNSSSVSNNTDDSSISNNNQNNLDNNTNTNDNNSDNSSSTSENDDSVSNKEQNDNKTNNDEL